MSAYISAASIFNRRVLRIEYILILAEKRRKKQIFFMTRSEFIAFLRPKWCTEPTGLTPTSNTINRKRNLHPHRKLEYLPIFENCYVENVNSLKTTLYIKKSRTVSHNKLLTNKQNTLLYRNVKFRFGIHERPYKRIEFSEYIINGP